MLLATQNSARRRRKNPERRRRKLHSGRKYMPNCNQFTGKASANDNDHLKVIAAAEWHRPRHGSSQLQTFQPHLGFRHTPCALANEGALPRCQLLQTLFCCRCRRRRLQQSLCRCQIPCCRRMLFSTAIVNDLLFKIGVRTDGLCIFVSGFVDAFSIQIVKKSPRR